MLEENARVVATDSGGVQREAYCLKVPCITLRERTEWVETLTTRWNALVPIEPERIIEAWHLAKPQNAHPPLFGDGKASEKITQIIEQRIREIDC